MEAGDSQWWLTARNKISSDFDKSQFPTQWQPRNTNIPTFSILHCDRCDTCLTNLQQVLFLVNFILYLIHIIAILCLNRKK